MSGTHTLKVWYSGPDKSRLALLGTLGESNVIQNGKDVWTWSSEDNEATHRTIDPDRKAPDASELPSDAPKTPQEAAQRALEALTPSTVVSIDSDVEVAGRPAYELVLAPKDDRSLISQVRVAVDGETSVPLRVQVFASGRTAFEVFYDSVEFARPDDSRLRLQPAARCQGRREG